MMGQKMSACLVSLENNSAQINYIASNVPQSTPIVKDVTKIPRAMISALSAPKTMAYPMIRLIALTVHQLLAAKFVETMEPPTFVFPVLLEDFSVKTNSSA